jgi:putative ABC transport system permease protein
MAWNKVYPETPFQYRFYDESLDLLYKKDYQTATLINMAMVVSIFISCMGLFGLSLHNAERRGKEISIRKVLGATPSAIAVMLSREFVVLILVSLAVASPVAWYFLHEWLSGFAYHISIEWWMFALAGMVVLSIAMFTTGYHLLKAAIVNPINKLRSE